MFVNSNAFAAWRGFHKRRAIQCCLWQCSVYQSLAASRGLIDPAWEQRHSNRDYRTRRLENMQRTSERLRTGFVSRPSWGALDYTTNQQRAHLQSRWSLITAHNLFEDDLSWAKLILNKDAENAFVASISYHRDSPRDLVDRHHLVRRLTQAHVVGPRFIKFFNSQLQTEREEKSCMSMESWINRRLCGWH